MLWKILIVIIEFFSLVMQRIFTQKVLHRRDTRWGIEVLAWGGFFALSNYMTYFVSKTAWENTIVFLTLFYLTLRILYTDSRRTIAAVTAFMAIGGVLSEFLTYYGWILVTHKSSFHIDSMNQNYLLTIISRLVLFVFIKLLILLILERRDIEWNIQDWIEIFMIPGGSIFILIALFNRKYSLNSVLDFIAVGMVMLINIFTYYLYDQVRMRTEEKTREAMLQEQSRYYVRQYEENRGVWQELSEFRHNLKERYLIEQMYLEQENYQELKLCYQNVLEKLQGRQKAANTGNFYFDSLINYKAEIAARDGISIEAALAIPSDTKIHTEDMYICLGNLLDNAIEAVKSVPDDKVIHLQIRVDGKNLYIEVSNPYEGIRVRSGRKYLTTKQEKKQHGFGLKIIKSIVENYHGEMDISDEAQIFTIKVLLFDICI